MKPLPTLARVTLSLLFTFLIWAEVNAQTSNQPPIGIDDPLPGQAVQGLIQIEGFIDLEEFDKYKLEFSFSGQDSWFPIISEGFEIDKGRLAEWDTSSITDGNYDLVLTVYLANGEKLEHYVRGIRVRNYTNIETDTPPPTVEAQEITIEPTAASTLTPTPKPVTTPTPLPHNRAAFSNLDIKSALIRGGILGIILFGFLTLFFLRNKHN